MEEPTAGGPVPSFLPAAASAPRSLGTLVGLSLRRPGGRRAVSAVTVVLLVSAVSMFAFPAFTDLFQRYQQKHVALNPNDPGFETRYRDHHVKVGQGLTRLLINNDRMKVNVVVVQGTTPAALNAGAGHYVNTPYPCERGNVGIAGHRTTYGRPFNKIDEMRAGDTVDLITPLGRCTYEVVKPFAHHDNPWVVQPDAYYVVSQDGALGRGHWLTLTSCNPLGSDSQRIVLRLRLVKTTPLPHRKAS
ncbi:MAG TPA: class E sortase [Mycobacteriales bacterium]|nr:class E sortase [Mycobacteriales bacterium]